MNTDNKDEVVYLYLDDIIPNRFQPREVFDERALKELAVSIREHGVIQPIIVRNVKGKYEIIAGERRYKASALAGLTKIPAIIRDLDDKESSKVALLENLQRKNLTPIEEARTYQKILEIDQMTQEDLAKTMGKSQSAVANKLRLLSLPDEIQESLLKEQISERHARALLNIPEPKKQKEMLKKIVNNKLSVRAVEEEIKKMYPKEEENDIKKESKNEDVITASTSDFVNNNPLLPTTDLPEDTSNYGKVTIAPPEGEMMPNMPKFINYGEINEDDDDDNSQPPLDFNKPIEQDDINKMKENSVDIALPRNNNDSQSADLDSLLNLQNSNYSNVISENNDNNQRGYNFITPAEEIVKTDENNLSHTKVEDYFKTPDLSSIELPSELHNTASQQVPLDELLKKPPVIKDHIAGLGVSENYTIEEATEKIRGLVADLSKHGININTDEMDFSKSYQIVIKIDKTKK